MDMVRKNKNVFGIKIDDFRLSAGSSGTGSPSASHYISNSESKNSLLMESSSVEIPYEMPLIDLDFTGDSEQVPQAKDMEKG